MADIRNIDLNERTIKKIGFEFEKVIKKSNEKNAHSFEGLLRQNRKINDSIDNLNIQSNKNSSDENSSKMNNLMSMMTDKLSNINSNTSDIKLQLKNENKNENKNIVGIGVLDKLYDNKPNIKSQLNKNNKDIDGIGELLDKSYDNKPNKNPLFNKNNKDITQIGELLDKKNNKLLEIQNKSLEIEKDSLEIEKENFNNDKLQTSIVQKIFSKNQSLGDKFSKFSGYIGKNFPSINSKLGNILNLRKSIKSTESELEGKKTPFKDMKNLLTSHFDVLKRIENINLKIFKKEPQVSLGGGIKGLALGGLVGLVGMSASDIGGKFQGMFNMGRKVIYKMVTRVPNLIMKQIEDISKTIYKTVFKSGLFKRSGVKLLKKTKIGSKLLSGGTSIFTKIFKSKGGNILGKIFGKVGKLGSKSIFRAIPIIGSFFDFYSGFKRLTRGDIFGSLIDFTAGIVDFFPGAGTYTSIALTGLNMMRDLNKSDKQIEKEKIKGEDFKDKIKSIKDKVKGIFTIDNLLKIPFIGGLFNIGRNFNNIINGKGNIKDNLMGIGNGFFRLTGIPALTELMTGIDLFDGLDSSNQNFNKPNQNNIGDVDILNKYNKNKSIASRTGITPIPEKEKKHLSEEEKNLIDKHEKRENEKLKKSSEIAENINELNKTMTSMKFGLENNRKGLSESQAVNS